MLSQRSMRKESPGGELLTDTAGLKLDDGKVVLHEYREAV